MKMKKANLIMIGVLFFGIMMASGAIAIEQGENLLQNSDFEGDAIGGTPEHWELIKGG